MDNFDPKEGLPFIFVIKKGMSDDEIQRIEKMDLEDYQLRFPEIKDLQSELSKQEGSIVISTNQSLLESISGNFDV